MAHGLDPRLARCLLPLGLVAVLVFVPKAVEYWHSHPAGKQPNFAGSSGIGLDPELPRRADEISVSSLLEQMIDLGRLTRFPDPPYVSHLASSYDRRSRSASDAEGWFANDDWVSESRPNYQRVETKQGRREYVLVDVSGPGALVRLWSATPTGRLRIYLDGDDTPALAADLRELLSGADQFPPSLAYVAALGYNSYLPIPFRKGCKVTVDRIVARDPFRDAPLEKFYYQINYRTYPASVADRVRSFNAVELRRAAPSIAKVSRVLAQPSQPASATDAVALFTSVEAGAELRFETASGARIRELRLRIQDTTDSALRNARLHLSFDEQPPVVVPLGDFFAGGPGLSPYESLPFSIRADGTFLSRWPMPFAHRAEIRVENSPGVEGEAQIESTPFDENDLYFRAAWQPPSTVRTRPFRDLTLLDARGRGVYVGSALSIQNPPGARWWGEGDDKVYVDGEAFPSHFGTGTEDHYGYAWSSTELFSRPFHAQTRAEGPGFGGRFAMNRFQLLDAIPFERALRFDLELWHWETTTVSFSAVTYYYARQSSTDPADSQRQ